jgi:hypothetical protein
MILWWFRLQDGVLHIIFEAGACTATQDITNLMLESNIFQGNKHKALPNPSISQFKKKISSAPQN